MSITELESRPYWPPRQACRADMPMPIRSDILEQASALHKHGRHDAALDLLYDTVDELLKGADFDFLDSILSNADPADLPIDLLLGLLTATLPARAQLNSRARLFRDVRQLIDERGENADRLLAGLGA